MRVWLLICFFLFSHLALFAYDVVYQGVDDKAMKKAFRSSSSCYSFKDKPLTSFAQLKRRAQKDQEKFTALARFHGHYGAKIRFAIQYTEPPCVTFYIELGPKYLLRQFSLVATENPEALEGISLEQLKITLNKPITTQEIIDAEKSLIWLLKKRGLAACQVLSKECVADLDTHTLHVRLIIRPGPIIRFGKTNIVGTNRVLKKTIQRSVSWNTGEIFDPHAIEKTQHKLEKTGLFTSVIIAQEDENLEGEDLPISIQVQESKHRSIGAGLAYATSFGPGVKAEWENRNLRGQGEKLTFHTEVWQKYQTVLLSWTKPHFRRTEQDLIWVAEYDKLHTVAFDSRSYNLTGLLQTRYSQNKEFMKGLRAEWLHSTNFEGAHLYHLLKVPLQIKWSNANNLLDPTSGETINVKITPTSNFMTPTFFYALHTTSWAHYHSFANNRLTLAAKVTLGNIMCAARHTIPPPDRFYGGSENVLRGFKAYTISPLHHKRIPIGGRSLLAGTLEARFRTMGELGWVFFYDVGNVYKTNVPQLTIHQFHSVGTGLRYATPIGPLRLDIAVPVNRRPNIDPPFQIYFSIGQAF